MTEADLRTAGEQLLAHYTVLRQVTSEMVAAVEEHHTDALVGLLDRRAAELDAVDALLAREDLPVRRLPEDVRERIGDAGRSVLELERRLQVLLSSGAGEVPVQLAQVRQSLSRLGRYRLPPPGRPEIVDRRG